ncbi:MULTISPECIES: hypothetical protein [Pseudomonas]|uniref:Uncharacterized protein n=1 Tax=Pseudomonas fluorescens TaxID=294 RepID=A0A5E6XIH9_PSEFL|nr:MULTISPECIES: hypothetical protein [Pseudomonas]VVN40465.1 hypothetical protein PS652_05400 [Pseudomonas fluorescens]
MTIITRSEFKTLTPSQAREQGLQAPASWTEYFAYLGEPQQPKKIFYSNAGVIVNFTPTGQRASVGSQQPGFHGAIQQSLQVITSPEIEPGTYDLKDNLPSLSLAFFFKVTEELIGLTVHKATSGTLKIIHHDRKTNQLFGEFDCSIPVEPPPESWGIPPWEPYNFTVSEGRFSDIFKHD